MGFLALADSVRAWFERYEIHSTVVWGERARVAQGNAASGQRGGRVSFLWPGNATGQGPTWLGPRRAEDTISDGGLIGLAAVVRAARLAHWGTGAPVHIAASSPSLPDEPTTLIEAFDVANALRTAELAHDEDTAAHLAADTVNTITAPSASNRATLRTLLLQLQERGNAHDRSLLAHGVADEDHDAIGIDPLSTSAETRAIAQLVTEIEAEVWAWDDSAPTNDAIQDEAWLQLFEATHNAVRAYAQGTFALLRVTPPAPLPPTHVRRGVARLAYFKLPVPIHQVPASTPLQRGAVTDIRIELPQGQEPDGAPIDPITKTVGTVDIP